MSEFVIQTNSDVPIYRQLADQVRRLAASGRLAAGERLPSVRQLAETLAVNPMTISKAYSLLEAEGLLERHRGIGMVLKGDAATRDELIRPAIEAAVEHARQLGLSRDDLITRIKITWRAASANPEESPDD